MASLSTDPRTLGRSVTVAGRYRLGRELGHGGCGVVNEAWDERLQRAVAIKRLDVELCDDWRARLRFQAAHESAASICHPAVMTIFDISSADDERPFVVMELIRGSTLNQVLKLGPLLEAPRVRRIAAEIADALAAIHSAGIVHRDVKPANVMLAGDGRVVLGDFGIARAVGDATITQSGQVLGTPRYLAPEVARGDAAGPPADVFGLGCVVVEMLGGQSRAGARAPQLARLVNRARADDPRKRPTATELARQLRATPSPYTRRLAGPRRRPPSRVVAGSAAILALLAAVTVLAFSASRTSTSTPRRSQSHAHRVAAERSLHSATPAPVTRTSDARTVVPPAAVAPSRPATPPMRAPPDTGPGESSDQPPG